MKPEAKPVPANWREELPELRKARSEFMEREIVRRGGPAKSNATPLREDEYAKLKRSEVLSFFETIRNTQEIVEVFDRLRRQYEADPDSTPDEIVGMKRRDFTEWWVAKHTDHYLTKMGLPLTDLTLAAARPFSQFLKDGDLDACYSEIESRMTEFGLRDD